MFIAMKKLLKTFLANFLLYNFIFAQWTEVEHDFKGITFRVKTLDSTVIIGTIAAPSRICYKYYLNYSEDGGGSWDEIKLPFDDLSDFSFASLDNIWVVTRELGKVFYTSNRGMDWKLQLELPTSGISLHYIKMFDSLNGIIGGAGWDSVQIAPFFRTNDGGNTWQEMNFTFFKGAYSSKLWGSYDFVSIDTGYFIPSYDYDLRNWLGVYKTRDGGATWDSTNFKMPLIDGGWIKFTNSNIGY